jgi:arylsulfatase
MTEPDTPAAAAPAPPRRRRVLRILVFPVIALAAAAALSLIGDMQPRRPDVVLIVVDALRPDHLSCYGYSRATSPNIDALAADGVLFLNNKSQSGVTMMSVASLLKSRYTMRPSLGPPPGDDGLVLAEVMSAAGWSTACVQTNPWLSRPNDFNRGFDDFRFLTPTKALDKLKVAQWTSDAKENVFYADAALVAASCEDVVSKAERPLFLYAHLMDAHGPYIPPAEFQRFAKRPLSTSEAAAATGDWVRVARSGDPAAAQPLKDSVIALYDAEIAYADWAVGRIVESLKRRRRFDNALIIVAADHGEGFLEDGQVLHAYGLYETLLRAPLIVKLPKGVARPDLVGYRHAGLTRNLDIAPTIFDAAGIVPSWGLREGFSLLDVVDGRPVVTESAAFMQVTVNDGPGLYRSLRYGDWKYMWSQLPPAPEKEELYDLRADPGEKRSLAADRPEILSSLRDRLAAKSVIIIPGTGTPMDAETEARLRALGYLQ